MSDVLSISKKEVPESLVKALAERVFRHGARVRVRGPDRVKIELAALPAPPDRTAYDLAAANMHKPWARRWMKRQAIIYRKANP